MAQLMAVWKACLGVEDQQVPVGDHVLQEGTLLVGLVGAQEGDVESLNGSDDLPHGVVVHHGAHHDEVGSWANFCFETLEFLGCDTWVSWELMPQASHGVAVGVACQSNGLRVSYLILHHIFSTQRGRDLRVLSGVLYCRGVCGDVCPWEVSHSELRHCHGADQGGHVWFH